MDSAPRHRIALVPPGAASVAWLDTTLRELQGADLLQPVTIVAPSPYLVAVLRQRLAERGSANVRFDVQLRPIAERIGRARGSRAFAQPLSGPLEDAAIRVAVRESAGSVLQPLAGNRSLQESLRSLFRELGHLEEDDAALELVAAGGSVGAAARRAYESYAALTQEFPDIPRQLRIAAHLAAESGSPWAADLGPLVFYLPQRLDAAEQQFLQALARHVPLAIALPWLDDDDTDRPIRDLAQSLAHTLNAEVEPHDPAQQRPSVHVISAPDPEEEARAVVRRVLSDMEAGVPMWRMAVLYTSEDLYAPLVRETLDAAAVPWHSALGRPASAGLAARSLLALLGLRERGFAREAVLDWLAARPTITATEADPLPEVPISAWDRLSRRAQVLQGAEQWIGRVERLIKTLEFEEQQRQDWRAQALAHEALEETPRPVHDLEHAHAILAAIRQLDRATRPPREPATWHSLVEWATSLRRTYVPDDPAWPDSERQAAKALDAALESLQQSSALEPTTTVPAFRDALAAALESRRLDEGVAGRGVLVAPLGASMGAAFERAYVLGMAEGFVPGRPAADPLTAGNGGHVDPLGRQQRQRAAERRGFLAALASSDSVCLSFARTDGAARASYPSRWLLEVVARIEGIPALFASDFSKLFGSERPWLEHIASGYDGLQRSATPMNVAELRLREVVAAHAVGHDLADSPVAARTDLVLGRALFAARARQSIQFTEFDGNLAAFAGESRRIPRPFAADSSGSSATSLERWAGCPYQYFLVNVLRVESTERPEEEWTISELDRGSLIHEALEAFFRERLDDGRSTAEEPFTPLDHARLESIAIALIEDLEAQGRTGHAVAWENARAGLLHDLHLHLDREEAWRHEDRLAPALFERTFGDPRNPDSWPAVEVPLADGSMVRFRGAIDRVDVSPTRVLVIDYKSGGTWGYDGLSDDPVLAGRHLQLVLYARAARANVAETGSDVRAEFRFVSSKGKFERRQIVADDRADARLAEVVQHAADGIRAGAFLPMPGEFDRGTFKNCRFCEYDRICSTTRDEAWRRKSPDAPFVPLDPLSPPSPSPSPSPSGRGPG